MKSAEHTIKKHPFRAASGKNLFEIIANGMPIIIDPIVVPIILTITMKK